MLILPEQAETAGLGIRTKKVQTRFAAAKLRQPPEKCARAKGGCCEDVVFSGPMRLKQRMAGFVRKRRLAVFVALALCLAGLAAPAFGWNDEGHMAVAYLAYQHLRPETRARVNALLKLNPYYAKWRAAVPQGAMQADTDRMIFMIAATWPDQIRSDPQYVDDGLKGGNFPDGPDSSRNIGYADHFRHKYWHFIDPPYSQDGTPLPPVPIPNVETQIKAFRAALGSGASDDVKAYDLAWLEHLVGDIHQPLHAITRVSATMPEGDAGGSLLPICAAPCRDSLHLFWDRLVGSQSGIEAPTAPEDLATAMRSATSAALALPEADGRLTTQMNETTWVQESFDLAKQFVYVGPIGPGAGPFTITPAYFATAKRVAQERVALAGVRLANLLNHELK